MFFFYYVYFHYRCDQSHDYGLVRANAVVHDCHFAYTCTFDDYVYYNCDLNADQAYGYVYVSMRNYSRACVKPYDFDSDFVCV